MDEIELPLTVDHLEAPLVKPTALHTVEFSSAQKESTPEKIANLTASFSSMSIATSPKCVLNSTNGGNSPTTQNGPLLKKSSLKKVHIAATDKSDNDEKSSTKKEEKGKPHTLLKVRMYHSQINKHFQGKIVNFFLPISFNICFGCSKEPSH